MQYTDQSLANPMAAIQIEQLLAQMVPVFQALGVALFAVFLFRLVFSLGSQARPFHPAQAAMGFIMPIVLIFAPQMLSTVLLGEEIKAESLGSMISRWFDIALAFARGQATDVGGAMEKHAGGGDLAALGVLTLAVCVIASASAFWVSRAAKHAAARREAELRAMPAIDLEARDLAPGRESSHKP